MHVKLLCASAMAQVPAITSQAPPMMVWRIELDIKEKVKDIAANALEKTDPFPGRLLFLSVFVINFV